MSVVCVCVDSPIENAQSKIVRPHWRFNVHTSDLRVLAKYLEPMLLNDVTTVTISSK